MKVTQVFIANDHAGFEAKILVKKYLTKFDFEVIDLGANSKDVSVDYPDFASILAKEIGSGFGILICGTGIGVSIAANRFANVRCALCHDSTTARLSREHNNANVLCFGSRVIGGETMYDIIDTFFSAQFKGGRHQKRVEKLGIYGC